MNFNFVNRGAIEGDFKKHLSGLLCLVLTGDVYKDKYGTKYFSLPVVRYLCMSNRVLKMIHCLTGSQWKDFKIGVT